MYFSRPQIVLIPLDLPRRLTFDRPSIIPYIPPSQPKEVLPPRLTLVSARYERLVLLTTLVG